MTFDDSYQYLVTFFDSIRDQNFSDNDIMNLCKQSINETRIHPNEESINRAESLVVSGLLNEQKLLTSYTFQYKHWNNPEAVIVICKKLENIFNTLTCDYTNALERYKFCARAFDFFSWMLDGIRYSIVKLDPLSPSIQSSIKYLLKALKEFTSKPFFLLLIYTYIHHSQPKINKEILLSHANLVVKESKKYFTIDKNQQHINSEDVKDFMDSLIVLPEIIQKVINGPRGKVQKTKYSTLPECHPGVLTLGTIFSCFNVTESDLEVAETILIFSHTVGIFRADMLFDILQIGPLIQAQDCHSQRNSLVEIFVYLRVPNILKLLIFELGVKKESLLLALKRLVKAKSLLNTVDLKTKSHLVKHWLKTFLELNLINVEEYENLLQIRNSEIQTNSSLSFLLDEKISDDSSLKKVKLAEQITSIIRKFMAQEDEKFLAIVEKFLLTTDGMMERVMAVMCATDELRDFALRLAKINQACENHLTDMGPLRHNRLHVFDTTFLLLIRIKYVFKDLRITLTQPELDQSRFFSWWSVYEKGLLEKSPLTTTENKDIFLTQYNILKSAKPFWNDTDEVGSIIDNIPGIGDLIFDDFRRGWPGIEKSIESMLIAFQQFPCIFVCFIQWLETQTPMSDNIRDFSRKVVEICKESLPKASSKSWAFAFYAVDSAIQHLTNRTPDAPYHVKSFLLTIAHRVMPKTHFMQAPEKVELKDAYYIATQQGYATPDQKLHKN
uniref:Mediator of RNA polymerase II transcription subunit 24 n=1 Tax=Panagrolaimus davidi TaxID=227884 RepID=A0A914QDM7_9BILA